MATRNPIKQYQKWCPLPTTTLRLILSCEVCALARHRKMVVPGRGAVPADILFIGEAPGRSENIMGKAFIGPSGVLLNEMINDAAAAAKLERVPSYFITNTVLCRPCDTFQGPNREPLPHEVLACAPLLVSIIAAIKPQIVVFIGKVSAKYYEKEFINSSVIIQHPAFLLRKGGKGCSWYPSNINILENVFRSINRR